MFPDWLIPALLTIITASTPLVFAAVGEVVVEKSGVLNLGVEGMMIVGAISAFAIGVSTGNAALAIVGGALAGAGVAFIFGFLTLYLLSNQVATGLALTIFGLGFSALLGHGFVGKTFPGLPKIEIPFLTDIPVIGPLFFNHDILVYLSVLVVIAVTWVLNKSRTGLLIRGWRKSPCGSFHRVFGQRHPDGLRSVWRRHGRIGRRVSFSRLHTFVGGKHDGGPGLDRFGAGGIRLLEGLAGVFRRLPVRRIDHNSIACAGVGR